MPALNLKKSGLHIRKFENAVLGLIFASNAIQSPHITCAVNLQGCLTDVDLRCLEFSKQRIRQLADAIAVGHTQGFLKAVNCLLVDDKEHFNLQDCVKRSDELTKDERPLSAQLDWVDWRYVMLKVSDFGWKKLDMDGCALGPEGIRAITKGIVELLPLQVLDLSKNDLGPEGGTAIVEFLGRLTSLTTLKISGNSLGPEGGKVILQGVTQLQSLQTLWLG
mmetsp:Transcript_33301/g.69745  ORF Transcript_33301/g.69745 Transcript_33301/m.69745 type:complete len:221 (-) Transcript_33301:1099-1761(-)